MQNAGKMDSQLKQSLAKVWTEYFNQRPINNLTQKDVLIIYT